MLLAPRKGTALRARASVFLNRLSKNIGRPPPQPGRRRRRCQRHQRLRQRLSRHSRLRLGLHASRRPSRQPSRCRSPQLRCRRPARRPTRRPRTPTRRRRLLRNHQGANTPPPLPPSPNETVDAKARDIIIALIGRIGAASTRRVPHPHPISPSPAKNWFPSILPRASTTLGATDTST